MEPRKDLNILGIGRERCISHIVASTGRWICVKGEGGLGRVSVERQDTRAGWCGGSVLIWLPCDLMPSLSVSGFLCGRSLTGEGMVVMRTRWRW